MWSWRTTQDSLGTGEGHSTQAGRVSDGVALKPLLTPWKLYTLFEKNTNNIEACKVKNERTKCNMVP